MNGITSINPVSPTAPVMPAAGIAPATSAFAIRRGADDASSLISGSSLKVRLAGTHADSLRLAETAAAVDVADQALASAHGALQFARSLIGNPDQDIDATLSSVQALTGGAQVRGVAILHEGTTLRAGASTLDVRPVSIDDLGAIVDKGRSHRLTDLRSGGTLDARANPDAAGRSADAAMSELSILRAGLQSFARDSVFPAQRAGLAEFGAIAGASPVTPSDPGAIRANLLSDAQTARNTLIGSPPEGVLRLLG